MNTQIRILHTSNFLNIMSNYHVRVQGFHLLDAKTVHIYFKCVSVFSCTLACGCVDGLDTQRPSCSRPAGMTHRQTGSFFAPTEASNGGETLDGQYYEVD